MELEELLEMIKSNDESEILDYKENLKDAEAIGRYISALGNSALITHSLKSYLIWGVKDYTKDIVGTNFNPDTAKANKETNKRNKKSNQMPLKTFLEKMCDPKINLSWLSFMYDDKKIVVLVIDTSHVNRPIKFHGRAYIRSGSSTTKLEDFPEKERKLWLSFESSKFELETAKNDVSWDNLNKLLDLDYYAAKTNIKLKDNDELIKSLQRDHIVQKTGGTFNITNMGAYTLARDIEEFPNLVLRTIRITKYSDDNSLGNAVFDKKGNMGFAIAFNNIIETVMERINHHEDYSNGERKDISDFPKIAIRELIANALVHQDFTVSGNRPSVEIFNNRIEIYNPGAPLISTNRFLDEKPLSRNDELANLLGKFGIVESRGTGIDKVVSSLESNGLPGMEITTQESSLTVVKLHVRKEFNEMSITEKVNSIYWNSCLNYVSDKHISNSSLRKRFNLGNNYSRNISNAINATMNAKLIKPFDKNAGRKMMRYIPFWGQSIDQLRG